MFDIRKTDSPPKWDPQDHARYDEILITACRVGLTMNKLKGAFISVLITLSMPAWGVDCFPADIHLNSQAAVDSFQATYGGGEICHRVTGKLTLAGAVISHIDGLTNLTRVEGDLLISSGPNLTDLDGLANLTSVGGLLDISQNAGLTNLDGLPSLIDVGALVIHKNAALTNIDGLAC